MKRKLFWGLILTAVANTFFGSDLLPARADDLYEVANVSENSDDHGIIFLGSFMGAATVIGALVGAANSNR